MFQHILVPLDGSLRAEYAIPIAARIARAGKGMLILLRVVTAAPEDGQGSSAGSSLFQATIQSEREEAQHYLTGIASSHQLADLPVIISVQPKSTLAAIQATIDTYQADLLVCCEQADSSGSQQFPGPFAAQLSQHLSIPLLLLPAQVPLPGSLADRKEPITYLIAFTGSQPEPFLIPPAASLLTALSGQESGHLHFAPLRSVLARTSRTYREPQATVRHDEQIPTTKRSAVLPKEAHADEKPGRSRGRESAGVFILKTPLPNEERNLLREMGTYPCLLVPSQGKVR